VWECFRGIRPANDGLRASRRRRDSAHASTLEYAPSLASLPGPSSALSGGTQNVTGTSFLRPRLSCPQRPLRSTQGLTAAERFLPREANRVGVESPAQRRLQRRRHWLAPSREESF